MSNAVQLVLGASLADAWAGVIRPWFERATAAALYEEAPWVVLTPARTQTQALKALLLAEGRSVAGLCFWTPGDLRDHLRRTAAPDTVIAVREHLHLLLALTASAFDDAPARAVARDPARLLRILDQLQAAGRTARDLQDPAAEKLAAALGQALQKSGWTTIQQLDADLAQHPPPESLGGLLVTGFDAAHWELWPLLQAGVCSAREAIVTLTRPRSKAEDLDQAWVGSWEERFGEAEGLDETETEQPFANLAQRMEHPDLDLRGNESPVRILVGRHVREQAEAVVAQCLAWLGNGAVDRLGILLPGPGPLAREISVHLLARGIPHYDAFGHPAPPSPSLLQSRAWIALQRSFRWQPLQTLMELSPAWPRPEGLEDALERVFTDVLVDDLAVLAARARQLGRANTLAAAHFLEHLPQLPAQATLGAFIGQTRAAWQDLGWTDLLPALARQAEAVRTLHGQTLSASLYLDWLEAIAAGPTQVRDEQAAQPLARVHLLPYAQAEGLAWSHLILADLNEGTWPPSFEPSGYLSDDQISALNRVALGTGSQGEGHAVVKPGLSLMLGPNERRALCRRQFYNLVEGARAGLALSCALESEGGSGRIQPASDFLSHLYFIARQQPLTEQALAFHQQATRRWLDGLPPAPEDVAPAQPVPVGQIRIAFDARRAAAPFGVYDCAFDGPPPLTLTLSCKQWQDVLRDPSQAWFAGYLGVRPRGEQAVPDVWPLTRGIWVHDWLAQALVKVRGRFEPRTTGGAIARSVRQFAQSTRNELAAAFREGGRAVPEWWTARWAQAEWMALQFAQRLGELEDWPWAATEWNLPKPADLAFGPHTLHLRGRVDLLLARHDNTGVPEFCWLADFKTGSDRELSAKTLAKKFAQGQGVQLALYALVLAGSGAREVQISLLTPESTLKPQLALADVQAHGDFWQALARLQDTGSFGMRGAVRSEYGVSLELPLATLPVEPDTLEEKWALTHPGLCVAEEEDEA